MEVKLKTGKHFGIDEKEAILCSITKAIELYSKYGATDVATRASCPLLNEGIQTYLLRKYSEYKCSRTMLENLRILGEQLFTKLKLHYHNTEFYISKGLNVDTSRLFWWPIHDSESRLKAMNILRQAIIDD